MSKQYRASLMIKYAGLAIFACICFLGGYFTGQWTTFRGPMVDAVLERQSQFFQRYHDIENHTNSYVVLRVIRKITPENHAEFDKIYSDQVQQDVASLESMLNDSAYFPYESIIKLNIKLLKSTLEIKNGS